MEAVQRTSEGCYNISTTA